MFSNFDIVWLHVEHKNEATCYTREGKIQDLWFIGCILIIIELEDILNRIIDMAVNDFYASTYCREELQVYTHTLGVRFF